MTTTQCKYCLRHPGLHLPDDDETKYDTALVDPAWDGDGDVCFDCFEERADGDDEIPDECPSGGAHSVQVNETGPVDRAGRTDLVAYCEGCGADLGWVGDGSGVL